MTAESEYIITEKLLSKLADEMDADDPLELADKVRSRPYNTQEIREKVLDELEKSMEKHYRANYLDPYPYFLKKDFDEVIIKLRQRKVEK